jgi:hypothetical protein
MGRRRDGRLARRRIAVSCFVALAAPLVARAEHVAHRFEPTDMDMQPPGVLQFDLQAGLVKGQKAVRLVVPDFEVNFGLAHNVELDVDGAVGVEGPEDGSFRFEHAALDNLWLSSKLGIFSWHDDAKKSSWAVGLQLGPKVPLADGVHGAGFESLLLLGRNIRRVHLVLNAGGLVDPGVEVSRKRPIGLEAGIDLNLDLNDEDTFSILGELGGILYFTGDPNQAGATAGLQWSPSEMLDLSIVGLVGFASGSDRYGVMLGVSPKVRLWK